MSEHDVPSEPTAAGPGKPVVTRTRLVPARSTAEAADPAGDAPAVAAPTPPPGTPSTDSDSDSDSDSAAAAAPAPAHPMAEADRHGFVSAFIGGVRPDGGQARSGKRLLVIGATTAVAVGLGALVVGAFSTGSKPAATPAQAGVQPAAAVVPSAGVPAPAPAAVDQPAPGQPPVTVVQVVPGNEQEPTSNPAPPAVRSSSAPAAPAPGPTGAPAPALAPAGQPQPQAPAAAKATYTAVAGSGCSASTTKFYTKDADYKLGTAGWLTSSVGGYRGDGCDGSYPSEPMSGDAGKYDTSQGVLWRFDFSGSFKAASCRLSLYIPDNSDLTHVGGNPTHYFFWAADYAYGMNLTPQGSFDVSQVANRGKWVTQAPFDVSTGVVTLKMVNQGVDFSSGTKSAHHAAAPVRLTCTSA